MSGNETIENHPSHSTIYIQKSMDTKVQGTLFYKYNRVRKGTTRTIRSFEVQGNRRRTRKTIVS